MVTNYEEHYQEAERLLRVENGMSENYSEQERSAVLAAAQVHATLALAAATRANRTVTVREDRP